MTDASQPPKIPWWVNWWTGPTTTRASLRQEAWLLLLVAAVSIGIATLSLFWKLPWGGVIVRPVAFGLFPVAFTIAGIWHLVAVSWIDRHKAWDRITTREEHEAHEANSSLWRRSLSFGLLVMVIGGAIGTVTGLIWQAEVGFPLGLAFGALGGFVLGVCVAGFREGVGASVGKPVDSPPSQDAEQSAPADGRRDTLP